MTTSRSMVARHRCAWLACWFRGVGLVTACSGDPPADAGPHASSGTTASETTTSSTTTTSTTSTSSTTTGALDGTASSSDDGVVFLLRPDGWGAMFECDLFEQDCAPGRKCAPYSTDGRHPWNATRCIRIASHPRGKGESCTLADHAWSGLDDCGGGLLCLDVDPRTLEGTCAALCVGDENNPTCADPCEECVITSNDPIVVCRRACDPLAQDCPPGQGCYWVGDELACGPVAAPDAGIGSPCEFINACPAGTTCLDAGEVPGCPAGSDGCCAPFCAVGADACAALLPGSSCLPLFEGGGGGPTECQSAPAGLCRQE